MGELRDRLQAEMVLRGMSANTQRCYVSRVKDLARRYRRSPAELGEAEVRGFVRRLVEERKVSASTHAGYVAARKITHGLPSPHVSSSTRSG